MHRFRVCLSLSLWFYASQWQPARRVSVASSTVSHHGEEVPLIAACLLTRLNPGEPFGRVVGPQLDLREASRLQLGSLVKVENTGPPNFGCCDETNLSTIYCVLLILFCFHRQCDAISSQTSCCTFVQMSAELLDQQVPVPDSPRRSVCASVGESGAFSASPREGFQGGNVNRSSPAHFAQTESFISKPQSGRPKADTPSDDQYTQLCSARRRNTQTHHRTYTARGSNQKAQLSKRGRLSAGALRGRGDQQRHYDSSSVTWRLTTRAMEFKKHVQNICIHFHLLQVNGFETIATRF